REERFVTLHYRAPVSREKSTDDANLRLLGFPHLIFSHAVHLARVEVDELTGTIRVVDYLSISDCGRLINPRTFAGQQEGAVGQGLGYALMEDVGVRDGRVTTPDLTTYILPTAADLPPMETIAVTLPEHDGPFGLKGAGEIGIDAPAAAVANAVHDACGLRLLRFPLTAEQLLAALTAMTGGHDPR
ncbi:MAG: molybdopterin-dependent oxidoreductase, partial [Desulfofustis sp.]|nr:molybdopterin-dependent oxidoreductase [Desulfofustis sp.]